MLLPLAQDTADAFTRKDPTPLYVWSAISLGVVFLLILVVSAIRKKYFPKDAEGSDAAPAGFGVSQLKELYDQGLLNDDEFNAAKAKIVAESHAAFMAKNDSKQDKAKKK